MDTPHLDIAAMSADKLHLPITDINLCVHFRAEGLCDEREDLSAPRLRGRRTPTEPQKANHYSLWIGFGWNEAVMLDIKPDLPPHEPYFDKHVETRHIPGIVRLSSKSIPTAEDIGTVLAEHGVRQGTTIQFLIDFIVARGLHRYKFRPMHKQQAGCRYWIYTLVKSLEEHGVVSAGCAGDMLDFLKTYYHRHVYHGPNRRCMNGGNWGVYGSKWEDLVAGSFYDEGKVYSYRPSSCHLLM